MKKRKRWYAKKEDVTGHQNSPPRLFLPCVHAHTLKKCRVIFVIITLLGREEIGYFLGDY